MSYIVGQQVDLQTLVRNSNGVLTDATVTLTVTRPDGTTVNPSVTHPATGTYTASIVTTAPGTWLYVWSASGAAVGVDDGQFEVTAIAVRISSLDELKRHLNKKPEDTTDDVELQDIADAAQVLIEREIGDVVAKPYAEYHNGGSHRITLLHGPIVSVTSVTEYLNGSLLHILSPSEYMIDPSTRRSVIRIMGVGYPSLFQGGADDVYISYVAGRAQPVPANIRLGHKELTAHLWRNSQIGRTRRVRGGTPEDDLASQPGFSMPNRVRELIGVKVPMVF